MPVRTRDWLKFGTLVAIAFVFGLAFASTLNLPKKSGAAETALASPGTAPPLAAPGLKAASDWSDAFVAVAEHVKPSVVFIRSQHVERGDNQRLPPGFQDFFPNLRRRPQVEQGSGSGFIVSSDGYILTNNHVVAGADKVTVRLYDKREFTAKVVGTDPNTDVAVIKIDARGLPGVGFGNSDSARVGEWVLAIGNPLGEAFTFTVTAGIVSAKGRLLAGLQQTRYAIQDFIQTDAAINPGNSGGPLVNIRGQVIGINSAIASETGFYAGYGFAIPMNLARTVMDQLVKTGRVERAVMGVAIHDARQEDADAGRGGQRGRVGVVQVQGRRVQQGRDARHLRGAAHAGRRARRPAPVRARAGRRPGGDGRLTGRARLPAAAVERRSRWPRHHHRGERRAHPHAGRVPRGTAQGQAGRRRDAASAVTQPRRDRRLGRAHRAD